MTAPPRDPDARLTALEQAVAALRADVATLHAELRAERRRPPPSATAPGVTAQPAPPPLTYATFAPAPASTRLRATARDWAAGLGVPNLPADRGTLETLVGRYGAVAVGALFLLMAVGAFLTWAVANFTLGPATRVALGVVAALALAALGERLRRREGARRFGEVLLALALAVVHVDAWAAGPYLHLVSAEWALGVAAVASVALTALAWRTRQQSLFMVGVGGALLAPFVSGAGDVHPFVRPVYGWVVLTTGLAALVRGSPPSRPWRGAARLLAFGAAVYAVAQLDVSVGLAAAATGADRYFLPRLHDRDLPPAFALACAAGPLAVALWRARRLRPDTPAGVAPATDGLLARLTLAYLTTTLVVLWALAGASSHTAPSLIAYTLAATLGAHAVAALPTAVLAPDAAGTRSSHPRSWRRRIPASVLAGFVLPLGLLVAALAALATVGTATAAGIAALWSALSAAAAAFAWRRADAARLGPHVAAAGLAGALVPVVASNTHDALRLALLGVFGAITATLFVRLPGRTPARDARPLLALAPPLVVLAGATVWGAALLHARPAFGYTPFLTAPSAGAAAVTLGWALCAAAVWRTGDDLLPRGERAGVVAVAAGVALLWGREELARTVAPDVATFLLVGYFAVAGVAALALGRARQIAAARQAGLALALYAALKALVEVSQLDAVALRVGSYLVVGGFLLGVGYWYRAGTTAEA